MTVGENFVLLIFGSDRTPFVTINMFKLRQMSSRTSMTESIQLVERFIDLILVFLIRSYYYSGREEDGSMQEDI